MKILIAIQARSTSTRFPGKALALLRGQPVLWHVIQSAKKSAAYINKFPGRYDRSAEVCLVCPAGDEGIANYRWNTSIVWGDLKDVLSRFHKAINEFDADYVVRLTGDCPMIPSFVISKMITYACENNYDYVSNVGDQGEEFRTSPDGFDCEVVSRRMLEELNKLSLTDFDREHVTTFIRREKPEWAKIGHAINYLDLSGLKLSIDTPEDLERVERHMSVLEEKIKRAEINYGKIYVHRF
jgi:spore coat polysaccharide biosynthesis protein SpsF (cytidylyltransferase family)